MPTQTEIATNVAENFTNTSDRVLDELRARQGFGRVLRGTQLPLRETHPLSRDGFRLRTPSLNQ